jgi:anti-sigma B factor antagonist
MKISQVVHGDVIILQIEGEINMFNAPDLKKYFDKLISEKKFKVVINFENVFSVDSSGLGALIAGYNSFKKNNGSLKFYCIPEAVRMLFKLTKFEQLFEIYETRREALDSF